jgi:hypothetical protein
MILYLVFFLIDRADQKSKMATTMEHINYYSSFAIHLHLLFHILIFWGAILPQKNNIKQARMFLDVRKLNKIRFIIPP